MNREIDLTIAKALCLDINDIKSAIKRGLYCNSNPDNSALKRVLKRAEKGEDITIVGFGGSITEGAWAKTCRDIGNNAGEYTDELGGELCYMERVAEWFKAEYKKCRITLYNAGIGATPSFLGAFRMNQMVLNHNPDLVIIEFAVNDATVDNLKENEIFDAYESLIRRCAEKNIATVLVFTMNVHGTTMQEYYKKIGDYYRIPMISYVNAIRPDGKLIFKEWELISPDVVHPNNVGHSLIARIITEYFEELQNSVTSSNKNGLMLPDNWLYNDAFYKSELYSSADYKECVSGAFEYKCEIKDVSSKWRGAWVTDGRKEGKITFTVPQNAKKVFILWFPAKGSFTAEFGDNTVIQNTQYPPDKYERASWTRVYDNIPIAEERELKIVSNLDGSLTVMGIMSSF